MPRTCRDQAWPRLPSLDAAIPNSLRTASEYREIPRSLATNISHQIGFAFFLEVPSKAKSAARRIDQKKGVRKSLYDISGEGALSAAADACRNDDDYRGRAPSVFDSSPVISVEHLAMLRAVAEE
jgi:hypothetical protein